MPGDTRICFFNQCKKPGYVVDMILDVKESKSGKKSKRYFHHDCHDKWKALPDDLVEQDSLNEVIKSIHGVPAIHSELWTWIQEVRMGTLRKGSRVIKKYREGIPYSIIEAAYKLSERDIKWAQENKGQQFNSKADEKLAELRYCFAIVKGKIPLAIHRFKKAEKIRRESEIDSAREGNGTEYLPVDDTPLVFKERENKNDIRKFLND